MFAAFNETSYDSDFKFIKTQHPPKFHYFVSFVVNSQNKLIPRCYPHSLRVFPHRILDFERSALGFGPTGEYKPSEKRKSCPKGTRNKTKAASSRKREEDDSESESENSDLEEQEKSVSRLTTTLNYVETHSLYFPVSWQAWTMVELASLNMVVAWQACIHACWNRLFMVWWTNRFHEQRCWNHHDKSTVMFIHGRTCCQGNDEITRLNSDGVQQPWTWLLHQVGFCTL